MTTTIYPNDDQNWVFGYGSLMWRPGFPYAERQHGRLHGAHRALCVYSYVHRGTPETPGLVLGLDRGGTCLGVAFRVAQSDWDETVDYLRKREQVTGVYLETTRMVTLNTGNKVRALTYMVDRNHEQYAAKLSLKDQLAHIRRGHGQSGPNNEYVLNTAEHLDEVGAHDGNLAWLARELKKPV